MDTTPFIESLRRDLLAAAEAAGPEGRAAADRMLLAFEPAMRLALLDALSQATAEITAELPAGFVEVRLRGREPELVVDVPPLQQPHPAPEPSAAQPMGDDEEEAYRLFQPEWSRGNVFAFLSRSDDGSIRTIDLSALNPYSPLVDSVHAVVAGEGDPMERMSEAVGLILRTVE